MSKGMTNLIAFTGKRFSGKDTAGKALEELGYVSYRFANPLKSMLGTLLILRGCPEAEVVYWIEGDGKEKPCPYLSGQTMRHAMQTLGTEWGRKMIGEGLWADSVYDLLSRLPTDTRIFIPDLRFLNEERVIRSLGGRIVRIVRPHRDATGNKDFDQHPSEQEMEKIVADVELLNDKDVADLERRIRIYAETGA